MRSEHKLTGIEEDALTWGHRFYAWRPGIRKKIKRSAHRADRQRASRDIRAGRLV